METAKQNAFDPHAWLPDTVARILDCKITKFDGLLPWRRNW
ncbi:MAG: transposase domain-containing protein [Inquilinaceae bacterium]